MESAQRMFYVFCIMFAPRVNGLGVGMGQGGAFLV